MSKPLETTKDNFEKNVLKNEIPVLVDFWATWCPPCKMIAPWIDEIASETAGKASVCKVNVDENPELAKAYNIRSVPTLLFFKEGEIRDQSAGAMPKEKILEKLTALL
jgi:thioredoxin 1